MGMIRNDEPATTDSLNRDKIARALASAVGACDTPLVIGIYGTWGTGKTTVMRLVQAKLDADPAEGFRTIWFDSWQHQFDDNPAIGLLHSMAAQLDLTKNTEVRELLTSVAGAFTDLTQWGRPVIDGNSDLDRLRTLFFEERFNAREQQILLRDRLDDLLSRATGGGATRLVFFIDDLDRCLPEYILKTLEALKLFLNISGCVFILGIDRDALHASIYTRYADKGISEVYLDKIVQVPFWLPPITRAAAAGYVRSLMPEEDPEVTAVIAEMDLNPRRLKRFVNSFLLNNELAKEIFDGPNAYDPQVLLDLLILQYRRPDFYREIVDSRDALLATSPDKTVAHITDDPSVDRLATLVQRDPTALDGYLHLSEVVSVRRVGFDVVITEVGEFRIQLIKVLREQLGLTLKEARDLVDSEPPIAIGPALPHDDAEALATKIRETGTRAEVR
ncbi:ribosomal protein L7/L12 [Actinokineospora inagensis]|uniref:ribosomal protein L7/L12 n=1 Tax=Actinokineospora inagensis TaxID=103730 RepID=UPI001FE12161|nr:ribosomal protein L7/L12 [Actinokineospora inagensis]